MRRVAFVYEEALSSHVLRPDHPMRPVRLRYTYTHAVKGLGFHPSSSLGSNLANDRSTTEGS